MFVFSLIYPVKKDKIAKKASNIANKTPYAVPEPLTTKIEIEGQTTAEYAENPSPKGIIYKMEATGLYESGVNRKRACDKHIAKPEKTI